MLSRPLGTGENGYNLTISGQERRHHAILANSANIISSAVVNLDFTLSTDSPPESGS